MAHFSAKKCITLGESVSSTPAKSSEANLNVDALIAPSISTTILSEVPCLLPCGHEQRTLNARFCSVCGQPVQSSSFEEKQTELALVFNLSHVGSQRTTLFTWERVCLPGSAFI